MDENKPVYPISIAAELLKVHPRTLRLYEKHGLISPKRRGKKRFFSNNDLRLRLYEKHGLISPKRRGKKRFFSNNDLRWINCIREMIHEQGLNITGIKRLLTLLPCWQVKGCSEEERQRCSARYEKTEPCWKLAEKICPEKFEYCKECKVYNEYRKRKLKKED